MTIDLEPEAPSGASSASVVLNNEGDQWVGMLIDYDPQAPLFKFGTTERELTPDGKEKTQDLLTVLLMPKTTCRVRMPRQEGQDEREEVDGAEAVGTVARIFISGHNRWTEGRADSFREAKRQHGRFQVGDVIRGRLSELTKKGMGGRTLSQDKKVISFEMRKAKPEEASLVARCVDEHQRLKAVPLESAAASVPAASYDDEPF